MYRLLVVDDEANIRNVVREYAEFEEYEVTEAENGMEAVALCREQDFDLIIMDVMMPRLDGFSACKEIKKRKNTPNFFVNIIFCHISCHLPTIFRHYFLISKNTADRIPPPGAVTCDTYPITKKLSPYRTWFDRMTVLCHKNILFTTQTSVQSKHPVPRS